MHQTARKEMDKPDHSRRQVLNRADRQMPYLLLGPRGPPAVAAPQEAGQDDNITVDYDGFVAALDAVSGSLGEAAFGWGDPQGVDFLDQFALSTGRNEVTQSLSQEYAIRVSDGRSPNRTAISVTRRFYFS
ncbi:hypothetical protein PG994_002301 [Apiospora phragmitis]|uniref:Uncharacterized protein n=1 Tax=Apiospora phragmitis TaxID=2905665 RepID=A0ABR1WW09_9PEZI